MSLCKAFCSYYPSFPVILSSQAFLIDNGHTVSHTWENADQQCSLNLKKFHSSYLLFCRNLFGHVLLICNNKLESLIFSNSATGKDQYFF